MSYNILLLEDELAIRQMLRFALNQGGFEVYDAENAQQATGILQNEKIDLGVVDWMLPGISGIEFCKRIKKDHSYKDLPLIMLTARAEEEDKIQGLNAGADDYVTKPFSSRELLARINALLRRSGVQRAQEKLVETNGLMLDESSHRVTANNKPVELGPTEYKLLQFLITHPERVFSRSQLLDNVWGNEVYVEERTVDVHIRRLRKALETSSHDRMIQTVRGAGYRFSSM
ncbi:MAG: phosphate regulon transcriptional regulator PhoB [Gammaproteobacteria bacterium]|nr:phosphate regulon transcriptional regulator PhoB [Gammaproteobacteria bacterium]